MEEVSFVLSHKSLALAVILSLVIVGGCIYIKILKEEVTIAQSEKAVIVSDLALSQASVTELQLAITNQNSAISKLQLTADARVASHKADIDAANQKSATYKQQAQNLMKATANPAQSKCDAVNELINSQIVEATQ